MKRIFTSFAGILCFLSVMAQDVQFRAQAPNRVVAGKPFQLTYSINQRARDLQAPEFNGFDYLAGPYTSQSSSTSFVNGKRSSTFTLTYTYTLMGLNPGDFTIGPATITSEGQTFTSNGVRITVLPPDQETQPQSNNAGNTAQSGQSSQSTQTGSTRQSDIFVRTIVTKTKVYEQEALQVCYRLYVAGVDFAQMGNTIHLPEFTGFLKQELELGQDRQFELEHYNNRNYQAVTLVSYLLYPQHAGDLKIEPAQFEAIIRQQTRSQSRSIFDDFFGTYENVSRMLTAPSTTVHVSPLPANKPAGYSGGVGQFTLTPSISTTDLQANDAVTLTLDIKGNGNMKLLKTPTIDWPDGFEPYDPKVTNNYKLTASGYAGSKRIEYLAIPREAGQYTIPAITFSYFDIQDGQYKTLTTPDYTLNVRRASGAAANEGGAQSYSQINKENIKELGTDIRFINTNENEIQNSKLLNSQSSILNPHFVILIDLLALIIAILIYLISRRFIRENADAAHVRYKKASKVAQKRLKTARALLSGDSQTFYAEIEKAAFSYLSDRLRIPTAELTKENISDLLRQKGVGDDLIHQVSQVLSTAEFARYAPTTGAEKQALYDDTTNIINMLENQKI